MYIQKVLILALSHGSSRKSTYHCTHLFFTAHLFIRTRRHGQRAIVFSVVCNLKEIGTVTLFFAVSVPDLFKAWGPFLERPGNLTGPESYFEIKVSGKVGCILTSNEVHIVSLADNFTVQFSNHLKLPSGKENKTA